MVEDRIGLRFAHALYAEAESRGQLEAAFEDMQMVSDTLASSKDLVLTLKSPIIPIGTKATVLNKIFTARFKSPLTQDFINLILRKEREQYLHQITAGFIQIFQKAHNISEGEVVSADTLSSDVLNAIQQEVEKETGNKFVFTHRVDPQLIGGFTLRVGDRLFDGSVSSSLRKLRQSLVKTSF